MNHSDFPKVMTPPGHHGGWGWVALGVSGAMWGGIIWGLSWLF